MNWATFLRCGAVLATAAETDEGRRLRATVNSLAADELEGRGTPSRGLDIAALALEMARGYAEGRRPGFERLKWFVTP